MISISKTFHIWCGLISSQGIPYSVCLSSLPIFTVDSQLLVSNCTYQTIIETYQLNLKDKDCLRQQIDKAILYWRQSWFTTHGRGERGVRSTEEKIITDVTSALILGTSDSHYPQAHSSDHLSEEYVITAILLVSWAHLCYCFTDPKNRWLRPCRLL